MSPTESSSDEQELPICDGYEDEGLDALLELAAGDQLKVNDTEVTLTKKNPLRDQDTRLSWARIVKSDEDRRLLGVLAGKGTYLFEAIEGSWTNPVEVESLSVTKLADVGWCEVSVVYLPTGGDHPADETHIIRANDEEEAKLKLEGRTPPIDYYSAIYTNVSSKLEIIQREELTNNE